jgi:hypothetical protein
MSGARSALQEAFAYYLKSPDTLQYQSPKRGHTVVRTKPRRIVRAPKDAPNAGEIIATPAPQCHANETFTGRTSTTHRVASAMEAGELIDAAENQPLIKALWLRFAYDPYLDVNPQLKNQIRAELIPLVWGIWCFWPKSRKPDTSNMLRLVRLVDVVMVDTAQRFRAPEVLPKKRNADGTVSPVTRDDHARALGYSSADNANWQRSWAPHEGDLYNILDNVDREALIPVIEVLSRRDEIESVKSTIRAASARPVS